MTRYFTAFFVALSPLVVQADEPVEARRIVERAIAAIGGGKNLEALKGGVWKTSGTVRGNPSQAEFHGELPGKFRIDSTRVVDGKSVRYSRIVNGDEGWVVQGTAIEPMTAAEIAGVKASFYHKQAATTLMPLKEKDVVLSVVGKVAIEAGKGTQIQVARKGYPNLVFTFDDKSGLLVKSEMTDKDPRTLADRKVEIEWKNYKTFDGVKMASQTKTYHDGKLFIDTEILDFKAAGRFPEKTFDPRK